VPTLSPMGGAASHSQPEASADPAPWQRPLAQALAGQPASSRRQLGGLAPQLLDLASNDYLGLSRHPAVVAAAQAAAAREGVGSGASRLVCGSRPVHAALERALAEWLGRERVLLFPSGFQANLAAVQALADRHSLVLADRLIHHSLLTGVRASGARLQRFRHNNLDHLEALLSAARQRQPQQRLLVLAESLYSMEGTSAAVPALAALCARHGAALLLDEAHAFGVLGPGGRGLGHGEPGIALVCGTLGKAFGSGGAFLAGDGLVIEWLLQFSGPFRYTTALAPPLAAGALAALEQIQALKRAGTPPGPALLARAGRWRTGLEAAGWPRPPGEGPILPLLVGDDQRALDLQQRLERSGLLAVAIRPPTVPPGSARLRLVLRADLPAGTLERLLQALGSP
jgi:8-amino-7-oxononanoate synthase